MSNVFKPKRSNTPGSVPTVADLVENELAVNTVDQVIYTKSGGVVTPIANFNSGDGATGPAGFGIYATARTAADGTILSSVGLSVFKISTGTYLYTLTDPYTDGNYSLSAQVIDTVTDTNAMFSGISATEFVLTTGEGDNSADPDVLVDVEHSVTVFGVSGPSGTTSAYETWLAVGNVGTEQDFLDSIEGATGSTGRDGATGIQGATGIGSTGATGATP